jgi:hypothetical protein
VGHQFAVGQAGGGEFFGAFVELDACVSEFAFEESDPLLELVDVVGGRFATLIRTHPERGMIA